MNLLIALLFLLPGLNIFAQTDWVKWEKAGTDYWFDDHSYNREYSFKSENAGEFVLKSVANAYWFFISDVDGDNCPFRPSCSSFFLDAVEETDIFNGALMFFDRFTRDLNFFKKGKYPRVKSKHYYDPAALYSLSGEIIYTPPNEIVNPE